MSEQYPCEHNTQVQRSVDPLPRQPGRGRVHAVRHEPNARPRPRSSQTTCLPPARSRAAPAPWPLVPPSFRNPRNPRMCSYSAQPSFAARRIRVTSSAVLPLSVLVAISEGSGLKILRLSVFQRQRPSPCGWCSSAEHRGVQPHPLRSCARPTLFCSSAHASCNARPLGDHDLRAHRLRLRSCAYSGRR